MAASSIEKTPIALVRNYNDVLGLSLQGNVFGVTNPTVDTGVTGQTSYAATLATLSLRNLGSKIMVPLYCLMSQTGTVAGGRISVHSQTLDTDQFTSGTEITVRNRNGYKGAAPTVRAYHTATLPTFTTGNATAVATLDVFQTVSAVSTSDPVDVWPFPGFVAVKPNGALHVYTDATITGPTWFFNIAWAEIEV